MSMEPPPMWQDIDGGESGVTQANGGGPVVSDPPAGPTTPLVVDLQITRPQDGGSVIGPWNGVTIVVEGTAKVTSGAGAIERVEVRLGTGDFAAAQAKAGSWASWSFSRLLTVAGTLSITARAIVAGHVVKQRTVTVTTALQPKPPDPNPVPAADTTPPAVAIVSPKSSSSVVLTGNDMTLAIAGTASDVGLGIDRVEVAVDGIPATVSAVNRSWSNWTAQGVLVGLGTHVITACAFDKAGLQTTASVQLTTVATPPRPPVMERLFLVQKCRLSSFLGAYGPGRTIKTLSLLPGEKTTIAVKSYRRSSETATESSSVLDSATTESEEEFQKTLEQEQANKKAVQESLSWNVEAKASANWGWGSASVSGGAAGASNAALEELAKSVSGAVQRHAAKAASKREMEIKSSREMKREEGEEFSRESQIENINLSRTLNFVFRQMNQEYVTLLHLVDVRVAYVRADLVQVDGQQKLVHTYREATLSQLDGLLRMVIASDWQDEVREAIMEMIGHVFDYNDEPHRLYEEQQLLDADGEPIPNGSYLRFPKHKTSKYVDQATKTELVVPGVILAAMKNVMPTDGVVCDAMLGLGEALDGYSAGLQREAIQARQLENDRQRAALHKEQLALRLVKERNAEGVKLFGEVYPAPETESLALVTSPPNGAGEP